MAREFHKAAWALVFSLSFSAGAAATSLKEVSGSWALHIDGKAMIVMRIGDASGAPTGELIQPKGMNVTNNLFSVADATADSHPLSAFADKGAYALVSFRDASGKVKDFELRPRSGKVEVGIAGVPPGVGLGPWLFDHAGTSETVARDWQPGRAYVVGDTDQPNAEMDRMFKEDQDVRQKKPIDWAAVSAGDTARRTRTHELIANGLLHTGNDFKEAAFIMQHGTTPDDYLLAHSLALAAMAKGESSAAWIAAATLDRFLWSKNLPQIYGTQFKDDGKGNSSAQPFNDRIVDEHIRQQLGAITPPAKP